MQINGLREELAQGQAERTQFASEKARLEGATYQSHIELENVLIFFFNRTLCIRNHRCKRQARERPRRCSEDYRSTNE